MAGKTLGAGIKRILEPLEKYPRATAEERLGSVLDLSDSDRDPVFIFNKAGHFLGLVSAYSAVYQKLHPYTVKVGTIVSHPPKINVSTSLSEIVGHMLSTRFYTLPIYEKDGSVKKVISADRIIKNMLSSAAIYKKTAEKLFYNPAISVRDNTPVKKAYKLLQEKGISRLLVTDKKGKLLGVVTRDDLRKAFDSPTKKQRFHKSSGDSGQGIFDDEKKKRSDYPISKYLSLDVNRVTHVSVNINILDKFKTGTIRSVVITDKNDKPLGYISRRDILRTLLSLNPVQATRIIMEKPKSITQNEASLVYDLLNDTGLKFNKMWPVDSFEISFKEGKIGIGHPVIFEITLSVKFLNGADFVVKTKDRHLLRGVGLALKRIQKKLRRSKSKLSSHKFQSA